MIGKKQKHIETTNLITSASHTRVRSGSSQFGSVHPSPQRRGCFTQGFMKCHFAFSEPHVLLLVYTSRLHDKYRVPYSFKLVKIRLFTKLINYINDNELTTLYQLRNLIYLKNHSYSNYSHNFTELSWGHHLLGHLVPTPVATWTAEPAR